MTETDTAAALQPILCSIPAAATCIDRSERFIYEAIATNQIRAVKSDKRTLVVVASLYQYAASLPPAKIKPLPVPVRKGGRKQVRAST